MSTYLYDIPVEFWPDLLGYDPDDPEEIREYFGIPEDNFWEEEQP